MDQNVRYSNGPLRQVTLPFEYGTPILSGIQMNQVFSIQMVIVVDFEMSGIQMPGSYYFPGK